VSCPDGAAETVRFSGGIFLIYKVLLGTCKKKKKTPFGDGGLEKLY
jgi:hypothetical protein